MLYDAQRQIYVNLLRKTLSDSASEIIIFENIIFNTCIYLLRAGQGRISFMYTSYCQKRL